MMKWHWAVAAAVVLCVGCGAAPGGGDSIVEGPEEAAESVGEASQALAVGCAAVVVSSEAHVGWLAYNPTDTFIDKLSYRIHNTSSTDCATMKLTFRLYDDQTGATIRQADLITSLSANKYRVVYWDKNYDSGPEWWVTAELLRNGTPIKYTYMPSYFVQTGQN
jgi:hypothetical protein